MLAVIDLDKLLAIERATVEEPPPRSGFFEHDEYLAIRAHLPPDYQDVLDFGYQCADGVGVR